jgi:hypothetical protein
MPKPGAQVQLLKSERFHSMAKLAPMKSNEIRMAMNVFMVVLCMFSIGTTLQKEGNVWMYPATIALLQSVIFVIGAHELNIGSDEASAG